MLSSSHKPSAALGLLPLLLGALYAGGARADISDTIKPFVSVAYTYDDNLLRLPDEFPTVFGPRGDRATQTQAGVLFDRPIGRQRLTGAAKVSRVSFDHYNSLDYNGKDFNADLAWQLGNHLEGNLGGSYSQTLTPFTDFHSDDRNLRTQRREYVNGAWRFHPSWRVRGAFNRFDFSYELPAQRFNNRVEDTSEAGVDYLARSGSRVGLVVRKLKGRYDFPRRFGTLLDEGYDQDELKANIYWTVSGVTTIQVLAGYAKRKHDVFKERDASGANGRITMDWKPSGKLRFKFDGWRDFAAVESSVVNNSLNKGASAAATWDISAKLQGTASVRRERRNFERVSGVSFAADPSDTTRGATLGLQYQPLRNVQLGVSAFSDRRNGSPFLGTGSYRAKGASVNASVQF
jgi:exopolysaccharide biosynthesis operon protein EpsL